MEYTASIDRGDTIEVISKDHSLLSIERPYVWLLIALPLFVPSLFVPMSSDNSIYQSMAYDLLQFGRMPYLGSWDQNFPGIVAIHAVVLAIFGGSDLAF